MAQARPTPCRDEELRALLAQARGVVDALCRILGEEDANAVDTNSRPLAGDMETPGLTIHDIAEVLGVCAATVNRYIKKGLFVGDAAPLWAGGLDRKRYRWRPSQVPAIRALFTSRPVLVPPPAPVPKPRGRPPTRKKQAERKDIFVRLRDGT